MGQYVLDCIALEWRYGAGVIGTWCLVIYEKVEMPSSEEV